MRIGADVGRCQGYGNCVALDDEHFDLDDDGLVVVRRAEVTDDEAEVAAAAVQACPVQAIWVGDDAV